MAVRQFALELGAQVGDFERQLFQVKVIEIERTYSAAPSTEGILAAECPNKWLAPYQKWLHHLKLDAEPWQEYETRRLVAAHGPEYFTGLDLFGIA